MTEPLEDNQAEVGNQVGATESPTNVVSPGGSDGLSPDVLSRLDTVYRTVEALTTEVRGLQRTQDKRSHEFDERLGTLEKSEKERYYEFRQEGLTHEQAERELAIDRMIGRESLSNEVGGSSPGASSQDVSTLFEVAGLDIRTEPGLAELYARNAPLSDFAKLVVERVKAQSKPAGSPPAPPSAPLSPDSEREKKAKLWADYQKDVNAARSREDKLQVRRKYRELGTISPDGNPL